MASTDLTEPVISPVAPADWAEALARVFGRLPAAERQTQVDAILAAASSGELCLAGLWGAYRQGRLVGAAFSQLQPGRTAAAWLPQVDPQEPETTIERLWAAVCQWLSQSDVCFGQVLLEKVSEPDRAMLQRWGFDHLADLLYLVSLEDQFPEAPPATALAFESYSDANHDRLARIVEATYQQTLDSPQLNGVRSIEDVLAGYRATGVFDKDRWLIVCHQGRDVGCLLLADHPQHENHELVYMGMAPEARGRGWGVEITRYAQWLARRAGRPRLVLAVDAANDPAIRTYAACGFRAWDRRSVYLKIFRRADPLTQDRELRNNPSS